MNEVQVENAGPLCLSNLKKMSAVDSDTRLRSEFADAGKYVLRQTKTCAQNCGCEN